MPPRLKLSKFVHDRLLKTEDECAGNLYGTFHNKTLIVLGLCLENDNSSDDVHSFPTEIDVCGVFRLNNSEPNDTDVEKLVNDIDITDSPLMLTKNNGEDVKANFYVNDKFEESNFDIIDGKEIHAMFGHIRLKAQIPLICEVNTDAVEEGFNQLRKYITSGRIAFNFVNTNIYVLGTTNEKGYTGIAGEPTFANIINSDNNDSNLKRKKSFEEIDVVPVTMLKKATLDPYIDSNEKHAPVVHVDKKLSQSLNIVLQLDTLSMVHKETKLNDLYDILVESAIRCLWLLKKPLIQQFTKNMGDHTKINFPEIFHFYPQGCGHFVSRVLDKNCDEVTFVADRKLLHKMFLLPTKHPLFRKANRFRFNNEHLSGVQLLNPHLEVTTKGFGGELAVVKGKYKYYHYCQDGEDDDGWGCAYRSLQTLSSWFLLQGYTDKPVPTIKEIQKCLVEIGDKQPSFIGSRQWIGSTEVSFVLNTLFDLPCKIVHVSSGSELDSKGSILLNHFQVNGSPVMIGGGVLAHTILGVDYNRDTGNLMFLILDPHYTGNEDIKTIIKKGWCGWKGMDFWDKSSYYNMCLPPAPTCI